jgi:hypothetical protein
MKVKVLKHYLVPGVVLVTIFTKLLRKASVLLSIKSTKIVGARSRGGLPVNCGGGMAGG